VLPSDRFGIEHLKETKNLLVCVTYVASHSSETDEWVWWERDILQREAVTPFFPLLRSGWRSRDERSRKHVQPFHWIFTCIEKIIEGQSSVDKTRGSTYIQYSVLDINDLEFCRDGAAAIVCLKKAVQRHANELQKHPAYCTLANHIRHTILSKIIASLSISIHGDDARERKLGMHVVFVSVGDKSLCSAHGREEEEHTYQEKYPFQ
jgi:hypothetical protein